MSLCNFSFAHCIVCPSSYGFGLPLWHYIHARLVANVFIFIQSTYNQLIYHVILFFDYSSFASHFKAQHFIHNKVPYYCIIRLQKRKNIKFDCIILDFWSELCTFYHRTPSIIINMCRCTLIYITINSNCVNLNPIENIYKV